MAHLLVMADDYNGVPSKEIGRVFVVDNTDVSGTGARLTFEEAGNLLREAIRQETYDKGEGSLK